MKVLTLFSQLALQQRIAKALTKSECVVEMAASVKGCLGLFCHHDAVLIESDPANFGDVLTLVTFLRKETSDASIFVFERHLDLDQRLHLFDAGVDDCVREQFFSSEFAVRLGISIRLRQAASNLATSSSANILRSGDLELDLVRRRVIRQGKVIELRSKEFLLLEYLVRNVNRSVTRTMILEHVWHSSFEGLTNVVDVYISALRNKLDRDFPQKLVQTHRGVGYTLTCVSAAQPAGRQEQHGRQTVRS
jgi:two-component system, OmpR family, response regulator